MIDFYYWPTPNGHKVTIFLEEAGLDYTIHPVNIAEGEQFKPEFLEISPNNKMPAIVDHDPPDGGQPLSVFESGAILEYLAEKTGSFMPREFRGRIEVLQWLHWQMGGLGPMAGQNHHFRRFAPERIEYAIDRFCREMTRLYGVLDRRLEGRDFICNEYSIVDMACYPWILPWEMQGQRLDEFPALEVWFERMGSRPAVKRAYERAEGYPIPKEMTDAIRRNLFGQADTRPADR